MRFAHDCSECVALGEYAEYDLYFCKQGGSPTVIARFGNEDGDYSSGLYEAGFESVWPELAVAKQRATAAGYLPVELTDDTPRSDLTMELRKTIARNEVAIQLAREERWSKNAQEAIFTALERAGLKIRPEPATDDEKFLEWLCGATIYIEYNRYGYIWGHGFVCASKYVDDGQLREAVADLACGDMEANDAACVIEKSGAWIGVDPNPAKAMALLVDKMREYWATL